MHYKHSKPHIKVQFILVIQPIQVHSSKRTHPLFLHEIQIIHSDNFSMKQEICVFNFTSTVLSMLPVILFGHFYHLIWESFQSKNGLYFPNFMFFVLIVVKRPGKQFFSHVETEPPIPGYYQYFLGSKCLLLKETTHRPGRL